MRFTVVGHGCVRIVGSDGFSLLVDPWLSGSCYWRSWWHYPPSLDLEDDELAPSAIYLSHHHFDHFHYPSLRRLDKRARVMVPKVGLDFMANELRGLGFTDIQELPHGKVTPVGGGLEVASFQYGFDDSALLVSDGETVIADLNDCKVRGRAVRPIAAAFGRPTFLLKNHSWAQSYPNRYTSPEPADLRLLDRADYAADFIGTATDLRPRYAVPFASNVCFLHPETAALNAEVITPLDVRSAFDAAPVDGVELVVMTPGDSWDSRSGFELAAGRGDDPWTGRLERIEAMAEAARPAIERDLAAEAATPLTWDAFESHFTEFVGALPPLVGRAVPRPIVFAAGHVDPGSPYWVVDVRRHRVFRSASLPADHATVVTIPPGLLARAMRDRIVNLVHISMRMQSDLAPGGVGSDLMFWGLLTVWELGYLPLRKAASVRALGVAWARRAEFTDAFVVRMLQRGPLVSKMTGTMMADADAPSPGATTTHR